MLRVCCHSRIKAFHIVVEIGQFQFHNTHQIIILSFLIHQVTTLSASTIQTVCSVHDLLWTYRNILLLVKHHDIKGDDEAGLMIEGFLPFFSYMKCANHMQVFSYLNHSMILPFSVLPGWYSLKSYMLHEPDGFMWMKYFAPCVIANLVLEWVACSYFFRTSTYDLILQNQN